MIQDWRIWLDIMVYLGCHDISGLEDGNGFKGSAVCGLLKMTALWHGQRHLRKHIGRCPLIGGPRPTRASVAALPMSM